MLLTGFLAAAGPSRRALRIQRIEALRTEGAGAETLRSPRYCCNIVCVPKPFRVKTVGRRKVDGPEVWEAVRQLTETAEQIRGSRALVPRGVHRFRTFEEAHEWMMEKIASTHASHGRKTSRKSARR
jgi:hypothetical protein